MWITAASVDALLIRFLTAEIYQLISPVEDTPAEHHIIYIILLSCNINPIKDKVMPKIDFGFGGSGSNEPQEPITDLETGKVVDDPTGQTTGLGDDNKSADKPADEPADNAGNDKPADGDKPAGDGNKPADDGNKPADDKFGDLVAGTVISIGEESYTVDSEGNLVDKDNKIFKEAAEVKEYLAQFEVDENKETPIDVNSIIKAVGVEVTDENDKPITFDNTPEGIAQYVNEVIELQKQEIAQAGVQTLLDKYPIVADFLNYYVANGNDARGFGEVKDRSSITIDENNIAQQEAIIREAYKENKRHGDVDAYIKYLKDTNALLDVAKSELAGLQQADAALKEQQAKEAQARLEAERKAEADYWNGVKAVVDSKEIAGYKIPDTIIINKNGKQIAATPNDFFNYLYQVDDKGYSRYERDLAARDAKEQLQDDLLRAYLTFTGGSYSNLVDLAVTNKETKNLRLKAAAAKQTTTVRVTPPKPKSVAGNIAAALGYS